MNAKMSLGKPFHCILRRSMQRFTGNSIQIRSLSRVQNSSLIPQSVLTQQTNFTRVVLPASKPLVAVSRYNSTLPSPKDIEKNSRSVFVGGLASGTDEEGLKDYFEQFGEVESVRIMRTFLGYSRNYGFVLFKDDGPSKEVLKKSHVINGKTVDVGKSRNFRVIYVGGLPSHFTEQTVREHFKKFGVIEAVKFIENTSVGAKTGYAFVTFSSSEEAAKAKVEEDQEILGCPVTVRARSGKESNEDLMAKVIQSKKLMVQDLDFDTTVDELREYFEKCGELTGIDLLINSEKRTCAAIVFFRNLKDIKKVVEENHTIKGLKVRTVQLPNEEKQGVRERTLFVDNLSEDTKELDVLRYFRPYGQVAKVHILTDRETGKSKGCGVVKLRHPGTVNKILEEPVHVIGKSQVRLRRRGLKIRPTRNTDDLSLMNFSLSLGDKR